MYREIFFVNNKQNKNKKELVFVIGAAGAIGQGDGSAAGNK